MSLFRLPLLYLDPGSGSLLLYALIGIMATLFFSLKGVWYRFKSVFSLGKGEQLIPLHLPPLVIHSEGSKYWQVFQPLIKELDRMNIPCAYVTPQREDFDLASQYKSIVPVLPGNEMATIAYMNRIKTDYVVTTTPHLDVYMLKRSPRVKKYIYLFHAPTSIDVYEKYAFNRYDIMLCPGDFVEKYIRELEEKRNLPEKECISVGCTYYDYMLEEMNELEATEKGEAQTILYAPTWGTRSSILKYGVGIIEILAEKGNDVIFRPHPQYYVSHPELIEDVEKQIKKFPNITIDNNRTGMLSMAKSDLMITDLSGIIFDFAYLYEKPVILIDVDLDLKAFEGGDLSESWNTINSEELSRVVTGVDLENISTIIEDTIENSNKIKEKNRNHRNRNLSHFGKAGVAASNAIIEIMERVDE